MARIWFFPFKSFTQVFQNFDPDLHLLFILSYIIMEETLHFLKHLMGNNKFDKIHIRYNLNAYGMCVSYKSNGHCNGWIICMSFCDSQTNTCIYYQILSVSECNMISPLDITLQLFQINRYKWDIVYISVIQCQYRKEVMGETSVFFKNNRLYFNVTWWTWKWSSA